MSFSLNCPIAHSRYIQAAYAHYATMICHKFAPIQKSSQYCISCRHNNTTDTNQLICVCGVLLGCFLGIYSKLKMEVSLILISHIQVLGYTAHFSSIISLNPYQY